MSMLLEALRKSEAQRHMGKAPDIHSPDDHRPSGTPGRTAPWFPAALMAVAAVAITYFVWEQYRVPEGPVTGQAGTDLVSDSPPKARRTAPAASEQGSASREESPGNPVENYRASPEDSGEAAGAEDSREALANSFEQYSSPKSDGPTSAAEDPPSTLAPSTPSAPTRGIVARPAQRQAQAEPSAAGVVSYWELPQNVRDAMPEFNITVLVFAERSEDRFLLMNGRRLKESEQVDGVRLEEIRRDGAVFRFRNYLFTVDG